MRVDIRAAFPFDYRTFARLPVKHSPRRAARGGTPAIRTGHYTRGGGGCNGIAPRAGKTKAAQLVWTRNPARKGRDRGLIDEPQPVWPHEVRWGLPVVSEMHLILRIDEIASVA
jgi:hypothetical protein